MDTKAQIFARLAALVILPCCSGATLAALQRAILHEEISRAEPKEAGNFTLFSTRLRVRKATRHLYATLETWRKR